MRERARQMKGYLVDLRDRRQSKKTASVNPRVGRKVYERATKIHRLTIADVYGARPISDHKREKQRRRPICYVRRSDGHVRAAVDLQLFEVEPLGLVCEHMFTGAIKDPGFATLPCKVLVIVNHWRHWVLSSIVD